LVLVAMARLDFQLAALELLEVILYSVQSPLQEVVVVELVKELHLLVQMVVLAVVEVAMMEIDHKLVVLEILHQHPHHKEIMVELHHKMDQTMVRVAVVVVEQLDQTAQVA
jgi:hypothetical protein